MATSEKGYPVRTAIRRQYLSKNNCRNCKIVYKQCEPSNYNTARSTSKTKPKIAFSFPGDHNENTCIFRNRVGRQLQARPDLLGVISFLFILQLSLLSATSSTHAFFIEPLKTANPFSLSNWNKLAKKLSPLHNIYPDAYADPVSSHQIERSILANKLI